MKTDYMDIDFLKAIRTYAAMEAILDDEEDGAIRDILLKIKREIRATIEESITERFIAGVTDETD